eukprot:4748622-Prymnesium_polylepis.1
MQQYTEVREGSELRLHSERSEAPQTDAASETFEFPLQSVDLTEMLKKTGDKDPDALKQLVTTFAELERVRKATDAPLLDVLATLQKKNLLQIDPVSVFNAVKWTVDAQPPVPDQEAGKAAAGIDDRLAADGCNSDTPLFVQGRNVKSCNPFKLVFLGNSHWGPKKLYEEWKFTAADKGDLAIEVAFVGS